MKPISDQFTVVLAGAWNRAIFAPEWVSKHLFEGAEIDFEVGMGVGRIVATRLIAKDIILVPAQVRLMVAVRHDHRCWNSCKQLATRARHLVRRALDADGCGLA